jgi:hypothetical protein
MKKDYEVGDGKPLTAGQFVKGKSGNRSGRPPSCLPKGTSASFSDILMKELDARIPNKEGGGPKRISKQRALIKNLVNRAVNGNARAFANLFKPVREHRLNLNNDYDPINISAERLYFVQELLDDSGASRRTSGLSAEQKERFLEDFYEHGVRMEEKNSPSPN